MHTYGGEATRRPKAAFTLIEALVVLLIIGLLSGIAFAIPMSEDREGQVRGAAEELAAVLRETRSRAIRKNYTYAVVFNIENAPGSSGHILNNRNGGHWYRVLGPADMMAEGQLGDLDKVLGKPPLFNFKVSALSGKIIPDTGLPALRHYLELVNRSWIDEPHVLAKGKVRFLALTDQDNGDNDIPAMGGYYTATYPRPWFGWWDSATKELHAWGGYEPNLKTSTQHFYQWKSGEAARTQVVANGRITSHSGFYYEGYDGEITGCVNPQDRQVLDDKNNDGVISAAEISAVPKTLYTAMKKGDPRPLINAKWVDFALLFNPDGSVTTDWFRLRNGYNSDAIGCSPMAKLATGFWPDPYNVSFPQYGKRDAGLADMCNGVATYPNFSDGYANFYKSSRAQREATDYKDRTGYYWITLAADAKDDGYIFPSAAAALKTMLPMYRIGVSPEGLVKVIRVRVTNYENKSFDMSITGSDWENRQKIWGKPGAPSDYTITVPVTETNYINHMLNDKDGKPRGMPVVDVVMPEMLSDRKWWWQYP